MKSKKLLLSSIMLLGGMSVYLSMSSNSAGIMGVSTTGCNASGCHTSSPSTTITLTGIPASGFTAGSTYTLTISVKNTSKVKAGFDLTVDVGTITNAPANTMLMGGLELHHTAPLVMTSGTASWVFSWTAPTTGSSATFHIAGNAVDGDATQLGDACTLATVIVNKAWPASVDNINQSGFTVYPNPATDYLIFKSSNDISQSVFHVVDINGNAVVPPVDKISTNEYQISTSALATGNYILKIEADGKLYTHLFTKN